VSGGKLSGKVVFITGTALGGQGRTAARLFAAEGAFVVGCDLDVNGAAETQEMVNRAGGRMISMAPIDLGDPQSARKWIVDGVAAAGGIDVLYNNASSGKFATIDVMTPPEWAYTIRNELDLIFYATQAAWPHMIARGGGVVINTASASGLRGYAGFGMIAHATAKAGIFGFTKQAAAEGARHNIRVNCICPGSIETPSSATFVSPEMRARIAATIPLGRWGSPDDIVHCALYLASDVAQWITGSTFVIDGGVDAAQVELR
jgi:meso-butanediol dehydrogenase/(S,S)-butanediol dehydrogenase/diacetyl reductase